jgi:hypothetical protein
MRAYWLLGLAVTMVVSACSGASSGAGKDEGDTQGTGDTSGTPVEKTAHPVVHEQSRMLVENFLGVVAQDTELETLRNKLAGEGCNTFFRAGLTRQADGLQVMWGECAGSEGGYRGLLQHCASSGSCVPAIWRLHDSTVSWEDAAGSSLTPLGVGLPVLLKQLAGHSFDKPTRVVTKRDGVAGELPDIAVDERRLYVWSSFGPLWAGGDLSVATLADLGRDSGAFTSVHSREYIHEEEVTAGLMESHPFDALVWLGQMVREEVKTNEVFKPVGMTVNAGLYGDGFYDRDKMIGTLNANPVRGPGLLVLVACESLGDFNGGGLLPSSLSAQLDNKVRVLVGFQGCTDARDLIEAARVFLESFFQGEQLVTSLDRANDYLSLVGGAVMVAAPGVPPSTVFRSDLDAFWQPYVASDHPGESALTVHMNIANQCYDSAGKKYQEMESFVSAWSRAITWNGPFFQGERVDPINQVNVRLRGALTDIRPGAHFFFVVEGNLGPKVQGITVYGDAVIEKIVVDKEKPDQFTIQFKGSGVASPYVNGNGDECMMQPPLLVTTTGEPSTWVIPMAWKGP